MRNIQVRIQIVLALDLGVIIIEVDASLPSRLVYDVELRVHILNYFVCSVKKESSA